MPTRADGGLIHAFWMRCAGSRYSARAAGSPRPRRCAPPRPAAGAIPPRAPGALARRPRAWRPRPAWLRRPAWRRRPLGSSACLASARSALLGVLRRGGFGPGLLRRLGLIGAPSPAPAPWPPPPPWPLRRPSPHRPLAAGQPLARRLVRRRRRAPAAASCGGALGLRALRRVQHLRVDHHRIDGIGCTAGRSAWMEINVMSTSAAANAPCSSTEKYERPGVLAKETRPFSARPLAAPSARAAAPRTVRSGSVRNPTLSAPAAAAAPWRAPPCHRARWCRP